MCQRLILNLILCLLAVMGCSDRSQLIPDAGEWSVPADEVFDGGPGKDGIPSIDHPQFTIAGEVDFMEDQDLVLGMRIGDQVRAYPHLILDWHEIVNDESGNMRLAITYCPLTGTGVAWDRNLPGGTTTFGVSGLLYNTNLMPYDRATNSTWSQQRLDCVHGELRGTLAATYSLIETEWRIWKAAYPESQVLNLNTGYMRSYGSYPYGDYRANHDRLLFPVMPVDNRLPLKERVLGVLAGSAQRVYRFNDGSPPVEIITDVLGGEDLVIVRSKINQLLIAFANPDRLTFTVADSLFPEILRDGQGNTYDLLGQVVEDVSGAAPLALPEQMIGYWFSWGAFYPGIDLYPD
ncbi:MAG: DUF3179 domain-containing protein [Saprospiraceae bacterium]|nr:DUF3179 domain-containing protein [Saprospiraceae bacterium]